MQYVPLERLPSCMILARLQWQMESHAPPYFATPFCRVWHDKLLPVYPSSTSNRLSVMATIMVQGATRISRPTKNFNSCKQKCTYNVDHGNPVECKMHGHNSLS